MKIYLLPIPQKLQPASQDLVYPPHNKDYGIEQDFLNWLLSNPELLTDAADEADWHYLPVFWTRWHINHNFAQNNEGIEELGDAVSSILINPGKTFTISQYDGGTLLDQDSITVFTSSRTTNSGIDIPLLCSAHRIPVFPLKKKYLASFNGMFNTHPIRPELREAFLNRDDVLVAGSLPTRFYKRWLLGKQYNLNILSSYVALCPRGSSCSSFRFFEAMQLGVVPCLIGDRDVRPFKKFIDWDSISYYVSTVHELKKLLDNLDKNEAIEKGKRARQYWKEEITYTKWCKYVLKELAELKN